MEPSDGAARPTDTGGVAAASHASASPFSPQALSKHGADPLVVAVLAVAAMFLGVAALPLQAIPSTRLTQALAHHRIEVASIGVTALVAALIALTIS